MWWPWRRKPKPKQYSPGCEVCGGYAMVYLGGEHLLCWGHYCAEMRAQREYQGKESTEPKE